MNFYKNIKLKTLNLWYGKEILKIIESISYMISTFSFLRKCR